LCSLVAAGLLAAVPGCYSGESGVYGEGWFSTDLAGGGTSWPVVAEGSDFEIEVDIAECFDASEELAVVSTDPEVVEILSYESTVSVWGWCDSHVRAQARAVAEGWTAIEVQDGDGLLVDELSVDVKQTHEIVVRYDDIEITDAIAAMVGGAVRLDADVYARDGRLLGHDGVDAVWNGHGSDVDVVLDEQATGATVSAQREGEADQLTFSLHGVDSHVLLHPVDDVASVHTAVERMAADRFAVYVVAWTHDGELVLNPPYEVEVELGPVDQVTEGDDRFVVETRDRISPVHVRVQVGTASHGVGLRNAAIDGGSWEELIEQGPPEVQAGCSVGGTGARPAAAALLLVALLAIRRRR